MIELRCDRRLHLMADPDTGLLEIKCQPCSKDQGQPVFHYWRMAEGVLERVEACDDLRIEPEVPPLIDLQWTGRMLGGFVNCRFSLPMIRSQLLPLTGRMKPISHPPKRRH